MLVAGPFWRQDRKILSPHGPQPNNKDKRWKRGSQTAVVAICFGLLGPFQSMIVSERPRSLLLSLGVPSRPHAWVLSWARLGPIPGPRGSRPDSPCALFYSVSDPSRSRGGGHPGPSLSHPAPERSFQDRAWTGRNRLLGHFRLYAWNQAKTATGSQTQFLRHYRFLSQRLVGACRETGAN